MRYLVIGGILKKALGALIAELLIFIRNFAKGVENTFQNCNKSNDPFYNKHQTGAKTFSLKKSFNKVLDVKFAEEGK